MDTPTTRQKALALNLDGRTYGAFAEIGGGQEVARAFFAAGGAAGTLAKSISAYDMAVSDSLYGAAKRYVSRERLLSRRRGIHGFRAARRRVFPPTSTGRNRRRDPRNAHTALRGRSGEAISRPPCRTRQSCRGVRRRQDLSQQAHAQIITATKPVGAE